MGCIELGEWGISIQTPSRRFRPYEEDGVVEVDWESNKPS